MSDKWTTKERVKLVLVLITLVFLALMLIEECSAQGLGGYGGLTIEQKRAKNMRRAQDNAIKAQLRQAEERARATSNAIRRKSGEANYHHNQRVLERQRKAKK